MDGFYFIFFIPNIYLAGNQQEEALSASVRAGLHHAVSDFSAPEFLDPMAGQVWLKAMAPKLQKYIPEHQTREDFLKTVYYEALRSGLNPQLVLALIQVERGFKKYAVSSAGARGFMRVMPF